MQTDVFAHNPVGTARAGGSTTVRLTMVHATERYGLAWVSLDAPVADIPATASVQADHPSLAWRRHFAALLQEVA